MRISDEERRARLVARHHLNRTAVEPEQVVRSVVALHSSDPVTPHLAAWARIPGFSIADLDAAMCERRTLVRVHAMRRTLFLLPAEDRAVFHAAVGADVAAAERRKLLGWLAVDVSSNAPAWLAEVEQAAIAALDAGELGTREIGEAVPALRTEITVGSGKWVTRTAVASRVLFLLALDGRIVRTRPGGSWRSSQYRWASGDRWLPMAPGPIEPGVARAELARRYVAAHGPVTLTDLRWWTGWTVARAKAALAELDVRSVAVEGGTEALVLVDDEQAPSAGDHTVALLPGLDPTAMGWKERDWYLGGHGDALFDRNGNAGPTVWVDGRMVGAWAQRPDGEVVYRLLEDVGAEAAALISARAGELTAWMDGLTITPRFRTSLERELAGS